MAGRGAPRGNTYARSTYDVPGHGVMIYISAPEWAAFRARIDPETITDDAICHYARRVFHQGIATRPFPPHIRTTPSRVRKDRKTADSFRHAINVWLSAEEVATLRSFLGKNARNETINSYARQLFHTAAAALIPSTHGLVR